MKKAFVDLDGTLVNSKKRHIIALKMSLEANGIFNINIDGYLKYKLGGFNTKKYLTDLLGLESKLSNSINNYWVECIENDDLMYFDKLYSDSFIFLKKIVDCGYSVNILTARKNKSYTVKFISNSKISDFISEIVIVNPINALYEKKQYIDSFSGELISVGDTDSDYYASVENCNNVYILNRGFRNKKFLDSFSIVNYDSLSSLIHFFNY